MGRLLFDQYTYLHFASGVIAYFWNISLYYWIVFNIIFEFVENTTMGMDFINNFKYWPGGKNYKDSVLNSVGDVFGSAVGWYSAHLINQGGNYYRLFSRTK